MKKLFILILLLSNLLSADELTVFGFEDHTIGYNWISSSVPGLKAETAQVKVERVRENATEGENALRLTFSGGDMPAAKYTLPASEKNLWGIYRTFKADVTVGRDCVVFFIAKYGKNDWTKIARLSAGKNTVIDLFSQSVDTVSEFYIGMYAPKVGEQIFIDNVRLTTKRPETITPFRYQEPLDLANDAAKYEKKFKTPFSIFGSDLTAENVKDFMGKMSGRDTSLAGKPAAEIDAAIKSEFAEIKKTHPNALLSVFRAGDGGFDPKSPSKIYTGWKDCGLSCHGPASINLGKFANIAGNTTLELFSRGRAPLMQADFSIIPAGAEILSARLVLVLSAGPGGAYAVEACNRPWVEKEYTWTEYAKDKFWQDSNGFSWLGEDPDFWPAYIAYGACYDKTGVFDFKEAVKFWTNGKKKNYGFIIYGSGSERARAYSYNTKDIKQRPAIYVIYEAKEGK